MSKASNLAGFATAVSPPSDLNVGIITSSGINVVGVVTATSFSGDGSALVNINGLKNGRVYFSVHS